MTTLDELLQWLSDSQKKIDAQVHVTDKGRGSSKQTIISIDHRLSCGLDDYYGWHIHTRKAFLPEAHFSSEIRHNVKTAAHERGRAIYCVDSVSQEVISVMRYHIDGDTGIPLLIRTLGFRDDERTEWESSRTLAGAAVLKHHAHSIAAKIGRGDYVDIDLANKKDMDLMKALGFRTAPNIRRLSTGGQHLRQPAPR